MIAGELKIFSNKTDDALIDGPALLELTEWGDFIELAFDVGTKRQYIRFRYSDLKREIKEQS
jgi:hypothetical protein